MKIAFYVCASIVGLLASPFIIWLAVAPFLMIWHGIIEFKRGRDWDNFWEVWFGVCFLFMMLAGLFAWLSEE